MNCTNRFVDVELLVHDLLPVSVQGTLTICIDKLQVLETIRDNAPVVSVIDDLYNFVKNSGLGGTRADPTRCGE